jgi:hypothetical protein
MRSWLVKGCQTIIGTGVGVTRNRFNITASIIPIDIIRRDGLYRLVCNVNCVALAKSNQLFVDLFSTFHLKFQIRT